MRIHLYAFIVIVICFSSQPAYAYIDPASGSLIAQAILGGVAGALAVLKIYWISIKIKLDKSFSKIKSFRKKG